MVDIIQPEKVFAERIFVSQDKAGIKAEIKLVLGSPELIDTDRWRCSFQIMGIGHEKIRSADGVDTLDALLMGLRMANTLLEYFSKQESKTITWLGENNLGLFGSENDL